MVRRSIGPHGSTVGRYHDDLWLNSIIYDVEFPDGQEKEYAANVISGNILAQVDDDSFSTTMLDSIVDWKHDESAVSKDEKYIVTKRVQRKLRKTTKGWKLQVQWQDGST
eukprot:4796271-Ditylum_brightwellii.AAC.1